MFFSTFIAQERCFHSKVNLFFFADKGNTLSMKTDMNHIGPYTYSIEENEWKLGADSIWW